MCRSRRLATGSVAAVLLVWLAAACVATPVLAAPGKQVRLTVSLVQEATYQYPHPPPVGLVLSTKLVLFAMGTTLGFPNGTRLGSTTFSYSLHGTCSTTAAGCSGTIDLKTLTRFPGGTITANGNGVSLANGIVVPIQGGTGVFKGVSGTIDIAPNDIAESIYHLVLPTQR